ncbi:metallophosphoesterase [Methanocella sp. CWC-04]|uniref:Phosphoesterase n=1 Tax=Methanooceanicella nereidis TaxID=2052831 RepID=A0AAP2RAW4_9EURY|nr:metallophosphoesterase family protein [Methanocella sp. CWC-04]MCD1293948.1 metallophosphoesterase [Methanocella sp. CWC-04]
MTRLLLISDIHANLEALRAIVDNVCYDEIFCMGDLVDYGPDPSECIEWVRINKVPTIKGNHDNAVAMHVDCGCGYKYKHLSEATREYTWDNIEQKDEDFLASLPLIINKEIDGVKFTFTHGSPSSFFEYIYPDTTREILERITSELDSDYLVVGHTHKPAILNTSRMTILNPGSAGQPRDGDIRASCMVFDTLSRKAEIIRLDYDIEKTCGKIRASMPHASELEAILRRGY